MNASSRDGRMPAFREDAADSHGPQRAVTKRRSNREDSLARSERRPDPSRFPARRSTLAHRLLCPRHGGGVTWRGPLHVSAGPVLWPAVEPDPSRVHVNVNAAAPRLPTRVASTAEPAAGPCARLEIEIVLPRGFLLERVRADGRGPGRFEVKRKWTVIVNDRLARDGLRRRGRVFAEDVRLVLPGSIRMERWPLSTSTSPIPVEKAAPEEARSRSECSTKARLLARRRSVHPDRRGGTRGALRNPDLGAPRIRRERRRPRLGAHGRKPVRARSHRDGAPSRTASRPSPALRQEGRRAIAIERLHQRSTSDSLPPTCVGISKKWLAERAGFLGCLLS